MGRAIVREPAVFLIDEPLSNLDAKLRVETRANIAALQARLGTTTIYVTHDQIEAMTMGHRVAVLNDGISSRSTPPRALYDHPRNTFMAGFIGSPAMNLNTLPLTEDGAKLAGYTVPLPRTATSAASAARLSEITLCLRPEAFTIASNGAGPSCTSSWLRNSVPTPTFTAPARSPRHAGTTHGPRRGRAGTRDRRHHHPRHRPRPGPHLPPQHRRTTSSPLGRCRTLISG
jgi:ABC-type sugar transport system ATPase subunit